MHVLALWVMWEYLFLLLLLSHMLEQSSLKMVLKPYCPMKTKQQNISKNLGQMGLIFPWGHYIKKMYWIIPLKP